MLSKTVRSLRPLQFLSGLLTVFYIKRSVIELHKTNRIIPSLCNGNRWIQNKKSD